jgi:hypothetical protein
MRHLSVRIVLLALLVVAGSLTVGVGRAAAIGFAAHVDYATGVSPRAAAVGDFNGDGFKDLAATNQTSNTVSILLGNGTGGFTATASSPATGGGATPIVVGDFNGDGKQDLAVVNFFVSTIAVLLGDGHGGFTATASSPATGPSSYALAVGDFNGDGKLDLAVPSIASNNVTVLLGDGSGGFSAAAGSPFATGNAPVSVAVGDFNGDGKQDLATANESVNTLSVLLGNGSGGFSAKTDYATGAYPRSVVVADLNGDGKQDLAVANHDASTVSILLGNGSGGFSATATSPATGSHPYSLTTADFNGDGWPDLATANFDADTVSLLLGDGTGGFTAAASPATGTGPFSITTGDFNGDGWPDLTTVNNTANTVSVLLSTLPTGTIAITGGGAYTNHVNIGLDLASATATQLRLRNEAATWGAWQPYAVRLSWALSTGDGAKTVSVQYHNGSGDSRVASAAIVLDTHGPVTSGGKLSVVKGKKAVFKIRIADPAPGSPTTSTNPAKPVKIVIRNAKRKIVKTLTATAPYATNKSVSFKWKKCTLKKGTYSYKVYAYDLAGNAQRKAGGNKLTVR